jgi:hypothetical protein
LNFLDTNIFNNSAFMKHGLLSILGIILLRIPQVSYKQCSNQVTISLGAARTAKGALLTWATASEVNIDHFELECNLGGVTFRTIGRQAGADTATTAHACAKTTLTGAALNAPVLVLYALGRVVFTTTTDAAGTAQLALPVGWPSGVYIV